jgi:hypothetical protein
MSMNMRSERLVKKLLWLAHSLKMAPDTLHALGISSISYLSLIRRMWKTFASPRKAASIWKDFVSSQGKSLIELL